MWGENTGARTAPHGHPDRAAAEADRAEREEIVRAWIRAELAPRELAARSALVVGVCVGTGFIASGIYDHTHAGRPDGAAAKLSLVIGAAVVLASCALLVLLGLNSRERRRLLAAYDGPGAADQRALRGRRAAWIGLSCLALFLALVFLASGLTEASASDPYDAPDPSVYVTLLLWAAVMTAAGCAGIRRARRDRPRTGGARSGKSGGRTADAPAPGNPRTALYSALGAEPVAPHRLSPRLSARLRTLSRAGAVTLATLGALLGSALVGATALAPRALDAGTGLFWTLAALTALFLTALVLELSHYGPHPLHLALLVLTSLALLGIAWNGFSTTALLERGRWTTAEVTDIRHHAKGGPSCDLRTPKGTPHGDGLTLGSCRAEVGDRIRIFYDPKGETGPRSAEPLRLTGFRAAWGTASAVLVAGAVLTALHGHRRRSALGLTTA